MSVPGLLDLIRTKLNLQKNKRFVIQREYGETVGATEETEFWFDDDFYMEEFGDPDTINCEAYERANAIYKVAIGEWGVLSDVGYFKRNIMSDIMTYLGLSDEEKFFIADENTDIIFGGKVKFFNNELKYCDSNEDYNSISDLFAELVYGTGYVSTEEDGYGSQEVLALNVSKFVGEKDIPDVENWLKAGLADDPTDEPLLLARIYKPYHNHALGSLYLMGQAHNEYDVKESIKYVIDHILPPYYRPNKNVLHAIKYINFEEHPHWRIFRGI